MRGAVLLVVERLVIRFLFASFIHVAAAARENPGGSQILLGRQLPGAIDSQLLNPGRDPLGNEPEDGRDEEHVPHRRREGLGQDVHDKRVQDDVDVHGGHVAHQRLVVGVVVGGREDLEQKHRGVAFLASECRARFPRLVFGLGLAAWAVHSILVSGRLFLSYA